MKATIECFTWHWKVTVNGAKITRFYENEKTDPQLRAYARRWLVKHMPDVEIVEE